jgi:hypothetical protein
MERGARHLRSNKRQLTGSFDYASDGIAINIGATGYRLTAVMGEKRRFGPLEWCSKTIE